MFTVSPNKQYRGILFPTTPATHGPMGKTKEARDSWSVNQLIYCLKGEGGGGGTPRNFGGTDVRIGSPNPDPI